MYRYAAAALVGAALAFGTRPRTAVKKLQLIGPKTGATYTVEEFPDAGFMVVKAKDGSRAVFQRKAASPGGGAGFAWQHGRGRSETLRAIYRDVVGEPPPASAVGPRAVPNPGEKPKAPKPEAPRAAVAGKAAPSKANRSTP